MTFPNKGNATRIPSGIRKGGCLSAAHTQWMYVQHLTMNLRRGRRTTDLVGLVQQPCIINYGLGRLKLNILWTCTPTANPTNSSSSSPITGAHHPKQQVVRMYIHTTNQQPDDQTLSLESRVKVGIQLTKVHLPVRELSSFDSLLSVWTDFHLLMDSLHCCRGVLCTLLCLLAWWWWCLSEECVMIRTALWHALCYEATILDCR